MTGIPAAPRAIRGFAFAVALIAAALPPAAAQTPDPAAATPPEAQAQARAFGAIGPTAPSERAPARAAFATADGRSVAYAAEVGTLPFVTGANTVDVFYLAYSVASDAGGEPRPITFLFNGGPGAASAYLAIGGLGPRVLAVNERGVIAEPPALVDNPASLLAVTDLVFVDPPGTGFSRSAVPADEARFFGVRQDAEAMATFVRRFLDDHGRARSPVFLIGESYGGFRVALLARLLPTRYRVPVEGIALISPALELSFLHAEFYDPLGWALRLPSFAAVNLERRAGGADRATLAAGVAEAERFALSDYLLALAGTLADGGATVAAKVADLTGLPESLVRSRFARISLSVFIKEYARASREVLSAYDGAISAPDIYPNNRWRTGPDPMLDRLAGEFSGAIVRYFCSELAFCARYSYRLLNRDAARSWDYGTTPTRQGFAGALDDLQAAREAAPGLEVLIAHGYTDLVTPYLTARFLVGQLPPVPGAPPIALATYAGGHMMYLRPGSRRDLAADIAAMVARALSLQPADEEAAVPAVPIP